MQNDFRNAFYQSAASACEAFPESLARCVFFLSDNAAPLYVPPEIADALSRKTHEVKELLMQKSVSIKERHAAGIAYSPRCIVGVNNVKMIGIASNVKGTFARRFTQEMRALYVLDHEIGHQVVRRGMVGGHESECRADAFAALRHIQRFGAHTDFIKFSPKAYALILGLSPIHYTQDILVAVQRYQRQSDIRHLSLHDTALLADHIVEAMTPEAKNIQRLSVVFAPVAKACAEKHATVQDVIDAVRRADHDDYELFCRELLDVVRANRTDPEVIKAANRFFNFPPMKKFIESKAQASPEWKDILALSRKRLKQHKPMPLLAFKGGVA